MFTIEMIPAGPGDCLWIEYGDPERPHRILIDGGVPSTEQILRSRIDQLANNDRRFELIVVSHIDRDHIGGILGLLRKKPVGLEVGDIWFNSWRHLPDHSGILGAKDAERLGVIIERGGYPWNQPFKGAAVSFSSLDHLPTIPLPGGMQLTLLSPRIDRLAELAPVWQKEIQEAGMEPGEAGYALEEAEDAGLLGEGTSDLERLIHVPFREDNSEANGSSIAVLAEFEDKRCVLAADAFAGDLAKSLDIISQMRGEARLLVNALKVSHHGGKKNTSRELLEKMACLNYLISTDGSQHRHPHAECIARLALLGNHLGTPKLHFNYRNTSTEVWDDWKIVRNRYEPVWPREWPGIRVEL